MTIPARLSIGLGMSTTASEAAFDADLRTRLSRAREHIPPANLAEFNLVLAHAWNGHHGWTMLWQSLSRAQRSFMSALGDMDGEALRIVIRGRAPTSGTGQEIVFREATARALGRFRLLDWEEPPPGAEWVVIASAKGRALLAALRARN